MIVYLLTPTGGRQEGLSLLGEYMEAQTYQGSLVWLIIDDVDPPSRLPASRFDVHYIRPPWRWSGHSTQGRCLLEGLQHIPDDARLLVIEDDDCYLPDYISTMLGALDEHDLVGERVSRYYNVKTNRYREMPSNKHASLMCTAMKGDALFFFRQMCRRSHIDMNFWKNFRGSKRLLDTSNTVGIKGMPGRGGIGVGHRNNFGTPDPSRAKLKEWIGGRAEFY